VVVHGVVYPAAYRRTHVSYGIREHCDTAEGFDHGVGHSLLLLYDAKVPRGQKSKEFNDLGDDPSKAFISLFYTITKYFIFITI
jgi:hypothetical protein